MTSMYLPLPSIAKLNPILPRHILTGSYHNYFRIYDVETLNDVVLQADKSAFKAKKIGGPLPGNKLGAAKNGVRPGGLRENMALDTLDFNKKILHASWHPRENTIAVCCGSLLLRNVRTDVFAVDCGNEQSVLVQRRMIDRSHLVCCSLGHAYRTKTK